jgi:hypothetical protein
MPFWAIISAGAIASISQQKEKIIYLISGLTVLMMVCCIAVQFFKTPQEISVWIYGYNNPFIESKIVAEKMQEITSPKDYVFIAGSETQILFYANRISSSRFVITYPFTIPSPVQVKYQEEAIGELKARPPKAIVVSQRSESGLYDDKSSQEFKNFLFDLIQKNYTLRGGYVFSENGGMWKDNLTKNDFTNASLLLYKQN